MTWFAAAQLDVAITKVDGQKVHVTGALTDEGQRVLWPPSPRGNNPAVPCSCCSPALDNGDSGAAGVAYSVSEGVFIDISHKKINSIFQGHPAERVFAQKPGK